ncbi:cell division protein DivIVA [Corynebacterium qintianiae]|uniref:cell division protein DivIVA n=1 Tax=Corynebacterium qintianiae TaxID=2709392 RepID=UPI001F2212B4|nr:cell division protein DivIVA [Corynebacterium qintianiae]
MLSWILLILVVAFVCLLGIGASVHLFGRGEAVPPLAETTDVLEHNRRAVEEGNLDSVQLEVVHRGYKMEQVDALIQQLADLRNRSASPEVSAVSPGNGVESDETPAFEGELFYGSNEAPHR